METSLVNWSSSERVPATEGPRGAELVRGINRSMGRRSARLGRPEPLMVFCECRDPACYSPLFVTLQAFEAAVREETVWFLREGHVPSSPASAGQADAALSQARTAPARPAPGGGRAPESRTGSRALRALAWGESAWRALARRAGGAFLHSVRIEP